MLWSWLQRWRRPAKKGLLHGEVILYTRAGCHLCDQAWEQLQQAQSQYGFPLRQVDIDQDPELVRLHGSTVPVVVIDGQIRFRGVINPVLLNRLLRTLARPS
jgi:glutaredoxin